MECTFCGKDEKRVMQLIAGPSCAICDECVALCNDIIDKLKGAHIEYASWSPAAQEKDK